MDKMSSPSTLSLNSFEFFLFHFACYITRETVQSPPSSSIDLHHSCFVFNHLSKTSTKRENFKTHHHHHHLLTSSERKREAGFNQSTFWIWISRKRETWGMKKHSFVHSLMMIRLVEFCLCSSTVCVFIFSIEKLSTETNLLWALLD